MNATTIPAISHQDLRLLIDGEWLTTAGRRTQSVVNPATGEVLGEVPLASAEDLDRAVAASVRAWPAWRALQPVLRARILRRASDLIRSRSEEIARLATTEQGKPLAETRIEVQMAANIFEWYAEEGRRAYGRVLPQQAPGVRMTVVKEPIGPVAAFAPWNFPLGNPARKLGAALAAGCPCILKPAEESPASALAIAAALVEAGVPAGIVNVVFGVPAEVSSHLIGSPHIRKVSFTGSVPVGRQLMQMASAGGKRTTMELGGHAPVLVFDDVDVDVDAVLDLTVGAKYRNAGQVCVSPTRYLVQEGIFDRFVAGFVARAEALKLGNGLEPDTRMGPLTHARRISAVQAIIDDAVACGAKLLTGGKPVDGPGFFFAPTVLVDVPQHARILNEEPFGPVAIINRHQGLDDMVAEANRLPFGLAAYAFTKDAKRVNLLGERLEAGMVGINSHQISLPESPFGGVKASGHGSEEGIEGLDACLVTKFITEG